jgi:hypothetical protein
LVDDEAIAVDRAGNLSVSADDEVTVTLDGTFELAFDGERGGSDRDLPDVALASDEDLAAGIDVVGPLLVDGVIPERDGRTAARANGGGGVGRDVVGMAAPVTLDGAGGRGGERGGAAGLDSSVGRGLGGGDERFANRIERPTGWCGFFVRTSERLGIKPERRPAWNALLENEDRTSNIAASLLHRTPSQTPAPPRRCELSCQGWAATNAS